MFLPMEVITVTKPVNTVANSFLTDIPSEIQVRQAIFSLYKKQEEFPDMYTYAKFPFGILDFDGLKMLQKYHNNYTQIKKKISEEKAWLKESEKACAGLGINIKNIHQYFQSHVWCGNDSCASIRNLVGKRWLSDYEIDKMFNVVNEVYDNTIGLCVSQPIFCTHLVGYMKKIQSMNNALLLLVQHS